jgi:hypothetical protein
MAIGEPPGQIPGYRAGQIIMWAAKMIGRPYLWGAGGPNSFDCSGLAWYCYSYGGWVNPDGSGRNTALSGDEGFKLATSHRWTTASIQYLGERIDKGQEGPGDLVMPTPGHVGICIGNNQYISAPATGQTVKIESYSTTWTIRRVVTPATQAASDNLTAKGTKSSGEPLDPTGKRATGTDEGQAIPLNPIDLVQDTLNLILDPLVALAKLAAWLAVPHHWMQIGEVVGGSAMVLLSIKHIASRVK